MTYLAMFAVFALFWWIGGSLGRSRPWYQGKVVVRAMLFVHALPIVVFMGPALFPPY